MLPSGHTGPSGPQQLSGSYDTQLEEAKTYRYKLLLTYVQTQPPRLHKYVSGKSVWVQLQVFSSLFMGCTWRNSCDLANVRCHAVLSDGKHMSTEVERKASRSPALTQSRYHEKGKRAADAVSSPSCVSLSSCQQWVACFSYFPETCISHPTRSAKKKATFHFRVHSVPKICKVLNQEAALSQRHTEPFIPILGENNHKEISQPAQLIKHRAWGYMCIQPYFPGFTSQALKPLPGAPEFNRWTLGFPDAPSSYGFRPVTQATSAYRKPWILSSRKWFSYLLSCLPLQTACK